LQLVETDFAPIDGGLCHGSVELPAKVRLASLPKHFFRQLVGHRFAQDEFRPAVTEQQPPGQSQAIVDDAFV
jgi:hypothetical protein